MSMTFRIMRMRLVYDYDIPENVDPKSDYDIPENVDPKSDCDIPENVDPISDYDIPENVDPISDYDIPENVVPTSDYDIPENVDPKSDCDIPENVDPKSDYDIPENVDPKSDCDIPENVDLINDYDIPENVDPISDYDIPENVDPISDYDIPENVDPISDYDIPEDVVPTSDYDIPENVDPKSDCDIPENVDPKSDYDIPENVDPKSDCDIPENVDLINDYDIPENVDPISDYDIPENVVPTSDYDIPENVDPISDYDIPENVVPTSDYDIPENVDPISDYDIPENVDPKSDCDIPENVDPIIIMLKVKTSTLRVQQFRLKRQLQKERESQDDVPPPKSSKCDTNNSSQLPASPDSAEIHRDLSLNVPSDEQLSATTGVEPGRPDSAGEILNVGDRNEIGPPAEPNQTVSTKEVHVCLCACCENCKKGQNTRDKSHLRGDFKKMARRLSIPYSHLCIMLKTLKPYHPTLPLCARTLLGHHAKPTIETHSTGDAHGDTSEFVYFGISDYLPKSVDVKFHPEKVLKLQFNFDGLTLFNSSRREFWTGLGKVYTTKNRYDPFVVQVHSGVGKPKVEIKSMVCDTPARAFIKSTKGHTGFYACERCTVHGFKVDNTTVYPLNEGILRTDAYNG
ncbi:hypothetical protein QAD02_010352 [Eretmocerus hayati]|uniref:Uncharacterized protein n=1 Tax=Eretmocerus hayati TaxID=131215 RepID=A0ACC2NEB9_9HYME|nr:hypothetical protein QAD02_010352 [Eretmocerus hayati]